MQKPPANRVVALLGALTLLAAALAPLAANMDWQSTAGILAGIPALAAVIYKFLEGWQRWESPDSFAPSVVTVPTPVSTQLTLTETDDKADGEEAAPRLDSAAAVPLRDLTEPALDPDLDGETFAMDDLDPEHEKRDLHDADHALAEGGEM
jgi:hypothetical protein